MKRKRRKKWYAHTENICRQSSQQSYIYERVQWIVNCMSPRVTFCVYVFVVKSHESILSRNQHSYTHTHTYSSKRTVKSSRVSLGSRCRLYTQCVLCIFNRVIFVYTILYALLLLLLCTMMCVCVRARRSSGSRQNTTTAAAAARENSGNIHIHASGFTLLAFELFSRCEYVHHFLVQYSIAH